MSYIHTIAYKNNEFFDSGDLSEMSSHVFDDESLKFLTESDVATNGWSVYVVDNSIIVLYLDVFGEKPEELGVEEWLESVAPIVDED